MIITKRIRIYINEPDKEKRREHWQKLRDNRDIAVRTANLCASHLFALDNTMPYLSDHDRDTLTFLGVKGTPATRGNAPYVAASEAFKGKADMGMLSCVIQNVRKMYQDDRKDGGMWRRSLRSYKADMPVPFKADRFTALRFEDYTDGEGNTHEGCFFTLIGIPFRMSFGRDRSGNRETMKRVVSGEYKMATSSLQLKDDKLYLLLCVDVPRKENAPVNGKKLYAFLGVMNPICCFASDKKRADNLSDLKVYEIGTKEEFNYRRRQIQESLRRLQKACRYAKGGHGRQRKTQAVERFHEREKNYVQTKLHTYSRMLVDYAVKNRCGEIVLLSQERREREAKDGHDKGDPFVLRNWSYYGLRQKIAYKAEMNHIKLTIEKEKDNGKRTDE